MSDQEEECKCPPEGLPAWLATFADLMTLLMSFFVLLLSFSEMDVMKFKQIAGSMAKAFGVQNEIKVKDVPKGTSVIAQEFSPGKPKPTLIVTLQQETIDSTKNSLDFETEQSESPECDNEPQAPTKPTTIDLSSLNENASAEKEAENLSRELAQNLSAELNSGLLELQSKKSIVLIRIREQGSFPSGGAKLRTSFKPVIDKIRKILLETKGEIRVAGHTDDRPIQTPLYPSNWELSGARAASVVRELLSTGELDRKRFSIYGLADTKSLESNDTADGRAKNRRVEIMIVNGNQSNQNTQEL
ncbi:MAG: flagellar motor protein MotB [Gammaproteobacteria bacterium CG22_combo_CG10-13_8_21_14_all_40_8]|nr:MAG: flagellar motor protein MotB [Gammaproteobacteria bacterium CG22_combo_CG10-13_8_21_14_all_40_8]